MQFRFFVLNAGFVLLGVMCAEPFDSDASPVDFYVATDGNDEWSGTLPVPNLDGTDGPFATLLRARNAVRQLPASQRATGVVVQIRGGVYRLTETVVFGLEDSSEGDGTITYEAYHGEEPVFSSAVEIGGWKPLAKLDSSLSEAARGKVWVADVPLLNGKSWRFFTLYDAEGPLPRARSAGFVPLPGGKLDVLHFPPGRLRNWRNLKDVEIFVRPHLRCLARSTLRWRASRGIVLPLA